MQKNIALFGVVNLPEMETAALQVMRSGRIASGEYVGKFEAGFGTLIGQTHVVTTVDMTSAIFMALHLSGVNVGDEVLTTAFACLSTNSAIAQKGAVPVWVDVKPHSVEIDLEDLAAKITPRTKAVLLYHVAGYPGPARELALLCKNHGLKLIEDCDNALLAERDAEQVGSHGDFAVYSFYPNRQINATDGGALVCKNPEHATRARRLRRFGIDATTFRTAEGEVNPASDILEIGWALTMSNLCTALACAQLPSVGERISKTRANAVKLRKLLANIPGLSAVPRGDTANPVYWGYLMFADDRDKLLTYLKTNGVMASMVHFRNDRYTGFNATNHSDLPHTNYLMDHILAIPCGWWLSDSDLDYIGATLLQACSAKLHLQ